MPLDPNTVPPNGQDVPAWRKQFPIDSKLEADQCRRQFVRGLSVAGGAMICGQVALQATTSPTASEAEAEWIEYPPSQLPKSLAEMETGETQSFHFPDHRSPCLLIKLDDDNFVAFGQKCTHLACPVIPKIDANEFHCPCHHGKFELATGLPLAGPPRSALPRVRIETAEDGSLSATATEIV